jgi:hypothetical protein
MALTADDVLEIHRLVALHGHLVDAGELHRLEELFTPGAVYDLTALGQGVLCGIEEFRTATAAFADDERNPVGHHVTNVVVTEDGDGRVTVRSKGLGVLRDGRSGSVIYEDEVARTAKGWRIEARRVSPSRSGHAGTDRT